MIAYVKSVKKKIAQFNFKTSNYKFLHSDIKDTSAPYFKAAAMTKRARESSVGEASPKKPFTAEGGISPHYQGEGKESCNALDLSR
ncbi:MAG: hypothetical protein COT71_01290 [Candidatus Andersenbacteria bacterium CG10_big_fil_rev_8_21_14_0_10_54_11]|uniref:Uncharacterized protein n=1 Tax=Candidatus Andersenbacteria bacterium CG10_big_fil_rev_8_21_14_0_10_54_11 TaxID=1974485 RepID=A0A2M6WZZ7_9BACT|nr:MAG: hypothetical protein COT71_01290 [Candidatus Andersenbacteria bacterium CG10_big_fil_rev_8_21_14_0_10_54_11]